MCLYNFRFQNWPLVKKNRRKEKNSCTSSLFFSLPSPNFTRSPHPSLFYSFLHNLISRPGDHLFPSHIVILTPFLLPQNPQAERPQVGDHCLNHFVQSIQDSPARNYLIHNFCSMNLVCKENQYFSGFLIKRNMRLNWNYLLIHIQFYITWEIMDVEEKD